MRTGNLTLMAGASVSNLRAQSLASDPVVGDLLAGQEAWIWYNSTDKEYKYFNGTAIVSLSSGADLSGYLKADGTVALTADLELSSADQAASATTSAVSKGYVAGLLANKLSVSSGALTANLSAGTFKITNVGAPTVGTDAARKIDIDNALSGLNWQEDILAVQTDATLSPTLTAGARYVLTNVASLHANFGTIAGVANNDIVQTDGTDFTVVLDASGANAAGAIAWNVATTQYVRFDGSTWSTFGGISSVTAGDGLTLTGNSLSVNLDTDGAIESNAGDLRVKLDGSSLARSATGLKIADAGVGYAQIAAAALGDGLVQNGTTSAIDVDFTGYVKSYLYSKIAGGDTAATSHTFTHNAGIRFGAVSVYDDTGAQVIPSSVTLTNTNSLTVTVPEAMKLAIVFVPAVTTVA